jgi:hypothetical protein
LIRAGAPIGRLVNELAIGVVLMFCIVSLHFSIRLWKSRADIFMSLAYLDL